MTTQIQAVTVPCMLEQKSTPLFSATTISSDHIVFSKPVLPIPGLIEIPLVMHKVLTWSTGTSRADLDNQIATYLNIDADSGFAPPAWQSEVGTVVVARKDKKPLLPQHVEAVFEYCNGILDRFGDGEGAPRALYNRAAFQKSWNRYYEQRKDEDDWRNVKSPYEF